MSDSSSCDSWSLENAWHGEQIGGLRLEEQLQEKLIRSKNQIEAVRAGMEKRGAKFSDREFNPFDDRIK